MEKINKITDGIRTEHTFKVELSNKSYFIFFLEIGAMGPEFNISHSTDHDGSFQTFLCLDPDVTITLGEGGDKISVKAAEIQQLYKTINNGKI